MAIVYLNGTFLPQEKACVSPLDRGFLFGDGVYEVIPVHGGHPFRLPQHLERLERSLAAVRIPNPLSPSGWEEVIAALLEKNPGNDRILYLQVTRGVSHREHAFPDIPPTVFAMCTPLVPPERDLLERGVAAILREDIRWRYCHIKATSLLPNVLLRQEAVDAGAQEAILVREGKITEGAASNVFAVIQGIITTPPKDACILPGITRDLVLELACRHGFKAQEASLTPEDLEKAEEIWLTSSTKGILPVTLLEGRPVGTGEVGPLWHRLHALYRAYKENIRHGKR